MNHPVFYTPASPTHALKRLVLALKNSLQPIESVQSTDAVTTVANYLF